MGVLNLRAITRQLNAIGRRLPLTTVTPVQRAAALEALSGAVLATPVDTGDARKGWQVTVGSIPSADELTDDPVAAGTATIEQAQPFSVIWITNNRPYIEILENGGFVPPDPGPSKDPRPDRKGRVLVRGGYSIQAPRGMLGIALERVRAILEGI
jgi:hypothetical protein